MPHKSMQFSLTITSLAPVGLVYAALFWFDGKPWSEWSVNETKAVLCLAIVAVLVAICFAALWFFSRKPKLRSLDIVSLKPADSSAIGFVAAYLLPVAFETSFRVQWPVLVVVFALLAVLVYVSDTYLVNPLLRLLGFHFYEVATEDNVTCVLVSRYKIRNTEDPVDVRRGSDFMYLHVKGHGHGVSGSDAGSKATVD